MPKLIISGATHELLEEVVTVGRAPENVIQLEDASVSNHHAELRAADKSYRLRDLGSTNGTGVNGDTATEMLLRHGDRIRFGAIQARFELDNAMSATQPLPVAEKAEARAATTSMRPSGFANASPFRARSKERDPMKRTLFIIAGIALLVLLAGLAAVLTMHAPAP
jgi:pSer/pThr/pTyr-binding forkhead associated (FHA) protein